MKPQVDALPTFAQFNLSPEMTKAITEMGFTSPSPIQMETLPILLKKPTDFLGLAATGTGKTAAFGIPLLEKLKPNVKGVQALILCPTRELAKQVAEQMNLLARYKKIKTLAIYGGSDYGGQLRALKDGVNIVVGTPGRIIDHIERKTLNLNLLQTVILDEADEMISMGFKEEIEFILKAVEQEEKHQVWLFSATMSRDIRRIADQFLHEPKQIQINKTENTTELVKQFFFQVREDEKVEAIERIVDQVPGFYGLIFCQTKLTVTELTQQLKEDGYPVDCLHGDMEQNARERTMKAFKAKTCTILVCTDVASRGIDVKELTHVINYSLPREVDLYVHRIGRTGRGGKEGLAYNLVTASHMGLIRRLEQVTKSKMTRANLPGDHEIAAAKLTRALIEFNAESKPGFMPVKAVKDLLLKSEWKEAIAEMSKEEIVARFLAKDLKVAQAPKKQEAQEFGRGNFHRGERENFGSRPRFERGGRGGGGGGRGGDRRPFGGGTPPVPGGGGGKFKASSRS